MMPPTKPPLRIEPTVYLAESGLRVSLRAGTMGAFETWAAVVLVLLGGFLVVGHLGVDLGSAVSASIHGLEHVLARPL
jgi:hypothetical protein